MGKALFFYLSKPIIPPLLLIIIGKFEQPPRPKLQTVLQIAFPCSHVHQILLSLSYLLIQTDVVKYLTHAKDFDAWCDGRIN